MCDFLDLPMDGDYSSNNMINSAMSQSKIEEKQILDAAQLSFQTGSMIPILKQELRYSILIRRVSEGKAELNVEHKKYKPTELTEYEKEKKRRRKEQNRLAAIRFRQKNKNKGNLLVKDIDKLQSENKILKNSHTELIKERQSLLDKIKEHLLICNFRQSVLENDLEVLFSIQ